MGLPRLSNEEISKLINEMDLDRTADRTANTFYRFFCIDLEYLRRQDEKQDTIIRKLDQLLGTPEPESTDRMASLDHNEY